MSYGQVQYSGPTLGARLTDAVPPPPESFIQVIESLTCRMGEIENQVNEITVRLFNPPMAVCGTEKQPEPSSASERVMDLRSRAMRVNEQLGSILAKL